MIMKTKYFDFSKSVHELAKRTKIEFPAAVMYDASIVSNPIVTMRIEYGGHIGIGHAICGPLDKFDENVGLRIALARAMRDVVYKRDLDVSYGEYHYY
jgi:hypothetical protein